MPNSISKPQFIGLDTQYPTANGKLKRRIHMDGAASPLAAAVALKSIEALLPHYSNSHSYVHNSAQIMTKALSWAHKQILTSLHANKDDYTAIFMGAGTTGAINRIARGLSQARPERKVVLVSAMEHHANDLPHRQFGNEVHYIPLLGSGAEQGCIDLNKLESLLKTHLGQVNYLAISAVSNVTGIINPIDEVTKLAHQYNCLVLVDAAQAIAHQSTYISKEDTQCEPDFVVFSGHKVYAPGSPGVLVAKKSLLDALPGQDLGGGSVNDVSYYDYQLHAHYPDREQSGTPNIIGAIALAKVFEALDGYGFDKVTQHGDELLQRMQTKLNELDFITVYGDNSTPRAGVLAFNHPQIDHGLLAAILNDYYCIAVRNECFCAHPYVSSMLKESLWELDLTSIPEEQQEQFINRKRGMVRASISLYNEVADVNALIDALTQINQQIDDYRPHYSALPDGSYRHNEFELDWKKQLNWS